MSRPTMQRNLTLTEELERLEQSITLTLQEIDSNFSKAHRIVTSSILPIVEQYAKHSNDAWEGSKFWKEFFEASADVSLTGYEEANEEEDTTQDETSESLHTPTDGDQSTLTGAEIEGGQDRSEADDEEFSIDSPTQVTGLQNTPKLPPSAARRAPGSAGQSSRNRSAYRPPSPRKYTGKNPLAQRPGSQPSTPRIPPPSNDIGSSPFQIESGFKPTALQQKTNNDPLMHRVLDKNYRIQATPLTQRRAQSRPAAAAARPPSPTAAETRTKALWEDSPQSSPVVAAPELRSELFSAVKPTKSLVTAPTRTPGLSLLTPQPNRTGNVPTTSTGRRLFSPQDKTYTATRRSNVFADSDSDDDTSDAFGGMSPPKTMSFHVPQSRLLQTPAREASRRIVEDLLMTAGAPATDEIEDGEDGEDFEEVSPSIVRRMVDDEDTF